MRSFWQDFKHGIRLLARAPGFTVAAVAMLGLGIGAATAAFGIVNSVLLRPLPFPDSDRVIRLAEFDAQGKRTRASLASYQDWAAYAKSFEAMAAIRQDSTTVVARRTSQRVSAARVQGNPQRVVAREVAHGRLMTPEEVAIGAPVTIVTRSLAERLWGDPAKAIGESLSLMDVRLSVIGVLAPMASERVDLVAPDLAFPREVAHRGDRVWDVLGKLRAGTALEAARAEMEGLSRRLRAERGADAPAGVLMSPMLEDAVRNSRPTLFALLAAAQLLLLLVCANIANLLFARGLERRLEIAVREALGASRSRIVAQLVVETLPLATLSLIAGMLLAWWNFSALIARVPFGLPRRSEMSLDLPALLFGLLMALAAGLFFALAPALRTPARQLTTQLGSSSRSVSGTDRGLRNLLVAGQFAVALALLTCAGLLLKSFMRLLDVDPGFEYSRVLVAEAEPPQSTYGTDGEVNGFWRNAIARVAALPGVEVAGVAESAPFDGAYPSGMVELFDRPGREERAWHAVATTGAIRALNIPLLQGRLFQDGDSRVVVVNALAAERFWPGQNPLGQRLRWLGKTGPNDNRDPLTVIGVVGNTRHDSLTVEEVPEIYSQFHENPSRTRDADLVVRAAAPGGLTTMIRGVFQEMDSTTPVRFHTLAEAHADSVSQPRFRAVMIGFFAVVALVLAAAGLYSSMSYAVGRQTREIGIRMALGGSPGSVRRQVLLAALRITVLGTIAGALLGVAGGRFIANQLFGVPAIDAGVFAGATLVLMAIALVAAYVPAHRASRTDPIEALRYE